MISLECEIILIQPIMNKLLLLYMSWVVDQKIPLTENLIAVHEEKGIIDKDESLALRLMMIAEINLKNIRAKYPNVTFLFPN